MHYLRIYLIRLCLLILLAEIMIGCTLITPKHPEHLISWQQSKDQLYHINNWQLRGKVAVQTINRAESATMLWRMQQQHYTISLFTPLGTTAVKLIGQPGKVIAIASNGKIVTAQSPEILLQKQWGFNLPISSLQYWIRGLPAPHIAYQTQFNSQSQLAILKQQGWLIEYLDYTQQGRFLLPSHLLLIAPSLHANIIINEWNQETN